MPNTRISLLVTSCNRHDLLKTTLESFYLMADMEPQEIIIYEDSDAPKPVWLNDFIWKQRGLRWLSDGERRGQAYACTRLIQAAKFEYIFWLEDDWLFQKQRYPFIMESKRILDTYPEIIQVSLRGDTGWHPLVKDPKYPFKIAEPYWRGVWGGWAWNPGLRRTSTCKELEHAVASHIGGNGLQHEEALSKKLLDAGNRIADLDRPICTHIGGNRSRAVEKLPPLPRILIAVPTCFEFDYESHLMKDDPAKTGFHQNGPNEQTQAVRDTWAKDVEPFKANVHLKFFYGKPSGGYPRQPLLDEVFLDCPDGYDSLIAKTVGICQYAAEHDYKILYKCDTDTFPMVDRLLMEIMQNKFEYAGFLHGGVCSGGPGYLLSQQAARIVATQGRTPQHPYAEDVHVSRVLGKAGIQPLMLPGHRPGWSAHFFFPKGFDPCLIAEDIVTMHALFPTEMKQCWEYLHKLQAEI